MDDSDLQEAAGTPGIVRRMAFQDETSWLGHAAAEPRIMSGWHHHGDNVTLGYVLLRSATVEFGPGGSESVEVEAGQYFRVPANTVHREGNTADEPAEVVMVRVGTDPPVFPADGPDPDDAPGN